MLVLNLRMDAKLCTVLIPLLIRQMVFKIVFFQVVSEYDQEIQLLHITDHPTAIPGRAT